MVGALMLFIIWQARLQEQREATWREERRELLERIQRPERVPTLAPEPLELPELTDEQIANQRAWANVGQVLSIDDSYGQD